MDSENELVNWHDLAFVQVALDQLPLGSEKMTCWSLAVLEDLMEHMRRHGCLLVEPLVVPES